MCSALKTDSWRNVLESKSGRGLAALREWSGKVVVREGSCQGRCMQTGDI